MEPRTIDNLLSDLTDLINFANPDAFRGRVMDFVRLVFTQYIGLDLIGFPFLEPMTVKNHQLQLPDYVLQVDDLSHDGRNWAGYAVGYDMQPTASLAYLKTPFGYRLPNLEYGTVYVKGFGLLKDEEGNVLIPFEAYNAILRFCQANLLEGQRQHPQWQDRYMIKLDAEQQLQKACVALRPDSAASRRTDRHATGQLRHRPTNFF